MFLCVCVCVALARCVTPCVNSSEEITDSTELAQARSKLSREEEPPATRAAGAGGAGGAAGAGAGASASTAPPPLPWSSVEEFLDANELGQ